MRLIDITGQKFGRLLVLRKSSRPIMWECVCDCGTELFCSGTNLRSGNTTSCGCLHREQLAASNRLTKTIEEPWLADMTLYVRKLRYRANRAPTGKVGSNQFQSIEGAAGPSEHPSLQWDLNLEDYTQLVTDPCFYCGAPPMQNPKGVCMQDSGLKRNGIDRVDNTRGYCRGNVVTCCTSCNREKRAQSQRDFIANTKRRYEWLRLKGLL